MTSTQVSTLAGRQGIRQDRPSYHVAPQKGWLNDPNGPLYYKGYYHMFYQHVPEGCTWSFGLVWGHAVSTDLVRWEHLPCAVMPTPGSMDADGCFSGCATLDNDGVPIILYTGVRLRSNEDCGPLPPPECDLQLPFIESQCAARPVDAEDSKLTYWTKVEYPWLSLPPPLTGLAGWRDPYIIGRPGQDGQDMWSLVVGSGFKEDGGTVLVYTSSDLHDGWQLHGELCHGKGKGVTTGFMWECPILCKLSLLPASAATLLPTASKAALRVAASPNADMASADGPSLPLYFFSVSPDACTNPSYYWLGQYDTTAKRFDVDNAHGPFKLDLGDVLYAPNTLVDTSNNRTILWGWNQEKNKPVGEYDHAGCLSLPRVLWLDTCEQPTHGNWALHQQPLPELTSLRQPGRGWSLQADLQLEVNEFVIDGGARLPVPVVCGPFLDLELEVRPSAETDGPQCSASGLLLRSWRSGAEGSVALLYHWNTGVLEVVFEAMDPSTLTFSLTAPNARRVGGKLLRTPAAGSSLSLRIFLDSSCLEVFTGSGEVLTARVYRGTPHQDSDGAGIDIISVDGPTCVLHAAVYEMQPAFHSSITAEEAAGAVTPLSIDTILSGSALAETCMANA